MFLHLEIKIQSFRNQSQKLSQSMNKTFTQPWMNNSATDYKIRAFIADHKTLKKDGALQF